MSLLVGTAVMSLHTHGIINFVGYLGSCLVYTERIVIYFYVNNRKFGRPGLEDGCGYRPFMEISRFVKAWMTKEKTLPGPLRQNCITALPRQTTFSREITKAMIDGSDRKI